jgi:phosphoribosylanthranilate isomerase
MAGIWIKICGLTTPAAIAAAAESGADAVGFVFHTDSPRNLDIDHARRLQAAVPQRLARVAVFLHPSQALVDEVVATLRPDWVQTDAEDFATLRLPRQQRILPVLRSGRPWPSPLPEQCLVESARSGAGETADWTAAARLAEATRVVLAGGLTPGNVADAVRAVRPFGVDVSSGVELSRGIKDARLIREFVQSARRVEPALVTEETRR